MIQINSSSNNSIKYSCDCGIVGECILKPQHGNLTIVVDIRCPHCGDTERVKILQYDSEESRKKLKNEFADLSWAIILDNRIGD